MTRWRKPLAGVLIFSTAVVSSFLTIGLIKDVQFAQAQEKVQATREQLNQIENLADVFNQVGEVLEPSVVQIRVTKNGGGISDQLPFNEEQLRRFFPDLDGDGQPDLPEEFGGRGFEQQGTGSGVIMETDGSIAYIITNNHVAGGASEMVITLADGRRITNAQVVGTDYKTDIAVLKVEADKLIPAQWGNSDELKKGDWVLAFGSPLGFVGSMTHGIVSALGRTDVGIIPSEIRYENFIQVDAPINPGNSGGPLVNMKGQVVGINTAIASQSGGFQGIGFAIPSNQAKEVYTNLKATGRIVRGFLGVRIDDISKPRDPATEEEARTLGYEGKTGVLVKGIDRGTPAFGSLQPGDIITSLNGDTVETIDELRTKIAATEPGKDVTMKVFRDGNEQDVTVKVGEQPDTIAATGRGPGAEKGRAIETVGIRLSDVNEELAQRYGLPEGRNEGAVVTEVRANGLADQAGVQVGDLITRVGKTQMKSAKEATDAINKADLSAGLTLYVTNREGSRLVTVQKR